MKQYYKEKDIGYFTNVREDLISIVKDFKFKSVLELGCSSCDTLAKIKELGIGAKVTGVDIFEIPNSNQQSLTGFSFTHITLIVLRLTQLTMHI